jgi:hypothetical protein
MKSTRTILAGNSDPEVLFDEPGSNCLQVIFLPNDELQPFLDQDLNAIYDTKHYDLTQFQCALCLVNIKASRLSDTFKQDLASNTPLYSTNNHVEVVLYNYCSNGLMIVLPDMRLADLTSQRLYRLESSTLVSKFKTLICIFPTGRVQIPYAKPLLGW